MNYKLLALDLDGTLLNDSENISSNNISYIDKASRKGIKIIITTGRSYNSAKKYIAHINVHDPTITFNGAVITDGGEVLRKITIKNEIVHETIQLLKDMDYSPIVYLADNHKYYETFGRYTDEFLSFSKGFESELVHVSNLMEKKWNDVIRLSVITGKYDVLSSMPHLKTGSVMKLKQLIHTFLDGIFGYLKYSIKPVQNQQDLNFCAPSMELPEMR